MDRSGDKITKQSKIKQKIFGTKAETLEKLKGRLRRAVIDDLIKFNIKDWEKNPSKVIEKIQKKFTPGPVIIRSSAIAEDGINKSNAGHFRSIGNVSLDLKSLKKSIEKVIASYDKKSDLNQFFVQTFISEVEISGVIFTRDLNTLAPYLTINYDDSSGLTDTVTSGIGKENKTLVIFKGKKPALEDKRLLKVLAAVWELESLLETDALDIEFLYKDNLVHILQVRPITIKNENVPSIDKINEILKNIDARIRELSLPHPDLYGQENIYGIMPDWNPAEMIGIKPRPLALSLYKELITDNIWAYQRDNYGYKRLRSFPLLVSLAGHPYIDVRVDFNSFIPKNLNDDLSHKLSNFYLRKLKTIPASHDKVEFDIVYSCYSLDLDEKLKELRRQDFSEDEISEIKNSLLILTNKIIEKDGLYKKDLEKIEQLKDRFYRLLNSDLSLINKIYWLTEDCKRYGTLPFAGIARAAFIATQLIDSLVNLKIITEEEKNLFGGSLNTVASQLSSDIEKLISNKKITLDEFLEKYGHLRPGTYDILSENYRENIHKYFDLKKPLTKTIKKSRSLKNFSLSKKQTDQINEILNKHNLKVDAEQLIIFAREAIEGREYAKLIFTRNVSQILHLITEYGQSLGFSLDDISYAEIQTFLKLYSTIASVNENRLLEAEITRNKEAHEFCKHIKLPYLICQPEDIYAFFLDKIEPNYITVKKVLAETILIRPPFKKSNLRNKIVFIENADPGFDWIFSHGIKGLITAYGGANSHMAIRAAELQIPAVIGCGPSLFGKWSQAKKLEIDCLNKKVLILS